jgi:hypothetical protein
MWEVQSLGGIRKGHPRNSSRTASTIASLNPAICASQKCSTWRRGKPYAPSWIGWPTTDFGSSALRLLGVEAFHCLSVAEQTQFRCWLNSRLLGPVTQKTFRTIDEAISECLHELECASQDEMKYLRETLSWLQSMRDASTELTETPPCSPVLTGLASRAPPMQKVLRCRQVNVFLFSLSAMSLNARSPDRYPCWRPTTLGHAAASASASPVGCATAWTVSYLITPLPSGSRFGAPSSITNPRSPQTFCR